MSASKKAYDFPSSIYQTPDSWGGEETFCDDSVIDELVASFGEPVDPGEMIEWDLAAKTDQIAIYSRTHSYTSDGKWHHQDLTVALRPAEGLNADGYFDEVK